MPRELKSRFFWCHYFIFISLSWGHLLQVLPQCQNLQQPFLRTSAEDLQLQHAHKHIETSGIKRLVTVFPSGERLSFTTPPAYATSFRHSCMSLRFSPPIFYFRLSVLLLKNHLKYCICIPPACFICVDREFVLVSKHWDAFLRLLQQAVFTPERLLPTEPLKRHIGAFLY